MGRKTSNRKMKPFKPGGGTNDCLVPVCLCVHLCVCLSQGFYSCTNIMTKKQVGEERVYSAYTSILLFITKEVRTGTLAGQKAGADAEAMEGCSLLACSAFSLIEPKTTSQRWSHPPGAFPPWSLIEKMPCSSISWMHFLNWSSFLCDNSSCVKLTHETSQYSQIGN